MATLSLPPNTRPLHFPHKHTLAQGSFGRSSTVRPPVLSSFVRPIVLSFVRSFMVRSSVRPIVRSFVRLNNLCSTVMLLKFRSFVRSLDRSSFIHSSYSSFIHSPYSLSVQIIFVQPLCCRNSDRSFVRSFDRSFIVPIHRSSSVHSHYSSFVHTKIHHYYSPLLFTIVTIRHHYYSSMISIITFLSLLFIDHPITPNFNYSSIMLSSPPKTCQTNIPVIRTSVTVIFLPVGTSHLVTHPRFLQVEHT
jgi:hypothetical protein